MVNRSEHFRQHHAEVRALAKQVSGALGVGVSGLDADVAAGVLRDMGGKFSVHLAIEDQTLYPWMASHSDQRVRVTAEKFQNEMGGLKTRFDAFRMRWAGKTAILRDPAVFVAETREILALLEQRIAREEAELYRLYDEAA